MHLKFNRINFKFPKYLSIFLFLLSQGGKKKGQKKEGGTKQKGEKTLPLTTGANDGTVKPIKPFNPMDDSVRLHECMSGLGTDEVVIVDILPRRTNDQRQEIKAKYQDKYTKVFV